MLIRPRRRFLDRPHLARVVPLAVALALAACGGSSNNDSTAGTPNDPPLLVDGGSNGGLDSGSGVNGNGNGNGSGDGVPGDGDPGNGDDDSGNNGGGNSDPGTPPPEPVAVKQILLSWAAVSGADGYKVYYSESADFDPDTAALLNDWVGSIRGTTSAITNPDPDKAYHVWVVPVTGGVDGQPAPVDKVTPQADGFYAITKQIRPGLNAIEVSFREPIRIPFSLALDPNTVDTSAISVEVEGVGVPITVSTADADKTLVIRPQSGDWSSASSHRVRLTTGLRSGAGDSLGDAFEYRFDTVDRASLVAWWEFDDSLTDLSGNGHDIDTNNRVVFESDESKFRSGSHAAYFDGRASLTLSDASFDFGQKFAVAFWVYVPALQSDINVVLSNAAANENTSGMKFGFNNWRQKDGRAMVEAGDGTVGGKALSPEGLVTEGGWYYYVYNVDTTADLANGRRFQIFFNGAEATVAYVSNMATMDWSRMKTTGPLVFGAMGSSYRLNKAYIDDLRIYNRTLTPGEVTNMAR